MFVAHCCCVCNAAEQRPVSDREYRQFTDSIIEKLTDAERVTTLILKDLSSTASAAAATGSVTAAAAAAAAAAASASAAAEKAEELSARRQQRMLPGAYLQGSMHLVTGSWIHSNFGSASSGTMRMHCIVSEVSILF
jgi:hypothetical protein